MAPSADATPGLSSFLRIVSTEKVETSVEHFVSLVKRRQISGSKTCAIATAFLLRRVIATARATESAKLLERVRSVGKRLIQANPRELVIGNIVRRILGLIRDEEDEQRGGPDDSAANSQPASEVATPHAELPSAIPTASPTVSSPPSRQSRAPERPPLLTSHTGAPVSTRPVTSMFSIISHPTMRDSGTSSPTGTHSPATGLGFPGAMAAGDLRAEVLEGIAELLDELDQADEQIANYSLDHISPSETIFTYSSSTTVQRFLLKAASKRKNFTVIHAEAYPNNHRKTHKLVTGNPSLDDDETDLGVEAFQQPLIKAGVQVIVVPDSAIFALLPRCSKCIISASAVMANGAFIATAGTHAVVKASRLHRVPVIVLAATYKLSPQYPHDTHELVEYGDVAKVIASRDGELRSGLTDLRNPLTDIVEGGSGEVELFITNVGGVAGTGVYRVVKDQYRDEDLML
jgi:translation initiation factor eIF-2B subunit beta